MIADITLVLDRSGSMGNCRDATIEGVNTFLREQKEAPGDATFTLVQFDDHYEVVYDAMPLSDVPFLTHETFVPRGSTALLDAMGRTVNNIKSRIELLDEVDRPDKMILVVVTDGGENASKDFTREAVFETVNALKSNDGWDIIYLGANQDAIKVAAGMGISRGSSATYTTDHISTSNTYSNFSKAVLCSRNSRSYSTDFSDSVRATMLNASEITDGSGVLEGTDSVNTSGQVELTQSVDTDT